VDLLNAFLRGEISVVETYRQALKVDATSTSSTVRAVETRIMPEQERTHAAMSRLRRTLS
jgi:hypothetical protein